MIRERGDEKVRIVLSVEEERRRVGGRCFCTGLN
jgi:hypothetical protein